jgi:hypothetical protein
VETGVGRRLFRFFLPLAGRAAGSEGERIAGLYLAGQLKRLGIPGAGPEGSYLQPVPLRELAVDTAATRLRFAAAGDTTLFWYGRDFVLDRGGAGAFRQVQVWLTLAAPGKIAAGIPTDVNRVDVRVLLPFVPERFHVQEMQRFGRVSGTRDNTIEVRGVNRGDLHALARPFWVRQVEPLEQGG